MTFCSLLVFGTALAVAQTPHSPLVNHTFKEGVEGWIGIGDTAKLSVSHDAGIALPSEGALKYDYSVAKGSFNALDLHTPLDSWTKGKSFKFRVRSDSNTLLAIELHEQDGGHYAAIVQVPKDKWQTVELSTSDFILSQNANDPKDPDGKLDMDRVTDFVVSDVAQFLVTIDNAALSSLFDIKQGAHTFYFDSFTISPDSIPGSTTSSGDSVSLDTLVHPQLSWIVLAGMKVSKTSAKPLEGLGLQADYHQTPNKPALLNRALQSWVLTGSKVLTFDIASIQPATIIVQLEQYDGGKYNMTVEIPGGSTLQHKKLLLDGFARGDDSTDKDTKLHLALVKSIAFIDVSGMMTQADKDNTLWLARLTATSSTN